MSAPYGCPICKHDDWCWPHHKTGAPCCRRIGTPDQLTYDRHGAPYYFHGEAEPVRVTRPPAMPLAPAALRSRVYRAIWWVLSRTTLLQPQHADQLKARGLPEELLQRAGLASWPTARGHVVRYLAQHFPHEQLLGVPGLYSERGSKLLKLGGEPGLAIPVVDLDGQWTAIRLRPDNPSKGKYTWLTSAGPTRGDGPGPDFQPFLAMRPGHFKPGMVKTPSVVITEGEPVGCPAPCAGRPRTAGDLHPRGRQLENRPAHPASRRRYPSTPRLGSGLAHQRHCGPRPTALLREAGLARPGGINH